MGFIPWGEIEDIFWDILQLVTVGRVFHYLKQKTEEDGRKIEKEEDARSEGGSGTGKSDIPSGYYQDSTGKWHRPSGQFASKAEMGIPETALNSPTGSHGNSLSDSRTNYGYVLVNRETGEILKFGETLNPDTRYSQSFLNNNATMRILESGSKVDIHLWQHDMNEYFKFKYGEYPLLNSKGW